jgi:hypothetical protein
VISPFDLRDVRLVRQLEGLGIALDTEAALTLGVHLLRNALASFLALGERGMPTYVLRKSQGENEIRALAQLRHTPGKERARIVYVAPEPNLAEETIRAWNDLLDHLAHEAGTRGAQSLVAEAPVDSPAVELLRGAGFAVYTRQTVFQLDPSAPGAAPRDDETIDLGRARLRRRRPVDMWDVNLLYANTAPRLLQLIEPPPGAQDDGRRHGYVLEDTARREMVGYLEVIRGPAGLWLKGWLHPDAEERAGELVTGAVQLARAAQDDRVRPVYWCVRRYQDWLRGPLSYGGFHECGSQLVMVRHTVARVQSVAAEYESAAALERANMIVPRVGDDTLSHRPAAR